ncbi:cell wall hydrolase [Bacillus horti]|uniref:LysM repeat protein n=1 Tax=Caldalkalibacillus horti TaxID=77523 RepID=A0ABT9W2B4_9BACI|nr:cell wall hydrolase [Bacillus horti]MDQ0167384.1 LysM repeat protein [Bacillus horti]
MKKYISIAFAITLALCVFATEGKALTEEIHGSSVQLDQEQVPLKDPLYMKDGRIFVPLRLLSEALDIEVNWHKNTQQVEVKTAFNDQIWFNVGSKLVAMNGTEYLMDTQPFMEDGRVYLPLKHISEILHTRLMWEGTTKTAHLTTVAPYIVEKGDSLESISKEFSLSVGELKRVNDTDDGFLAVGQELRVLAPEYLSTPLSAEDVNLLAKIIFIEAGYEAYEGQIAVGNVIMNRVAHSSFPDTIRDVIYHPGQFPPAHNGTFEQTVPSDTAVNAAREVLGGKEYARGALYFFNPNVTRHSFFTSKEVIATFGNHRFVR